MNISNGDFGLSNLIEVSQAFSEDTNFAYGKIMEGEKVYDTVYSISGSISFFVKVPLGATITATHEDHFIGTNNNCQTWLSRCDQNKIGFVSAL